jgi:adenine specific DNA methylase Mod
MALLATFCRAILWPMNTLYYGDNLDVLRLHVKDESVDLVYLDPPFKSDQDYNVLFAEKDGSRSTAQIRAFADTWRWDKAAAHAYQEIVEGGGQVSLVMQAFRQAIGENDLLAYLAMMAPRLVELRRVLKPTGSHYLKLLMDAVFGAGQFRNEIVWKRTHAHGSSKRFGPLHDTILFYSRSDDFLWTDLKAPHDTAYLEKHFNQVDADGRRFQPISLTGGGRAQWRKRQALEGS